jgi:uncharacterized protein YukE
MMSFPYLKRRLLSTSALVFSITASSAPALAQQTPAARIDAVERQIRALQQEHDRQIRALQDEVQRMKQEMATQGDALRHSQDQVNASQEAARQARAAAAQAQEQAKSAASIGADGTLQLGAIRLKPGGFAEGAAIYRTRNTVADIPTQFNNIPFKNSPLAHEQEFRGSARQSRFSLLGTADVDPTTHLAIYFESDFLAAGVTSNSRESNSYVARLRQGYGTIDLDRYGLHILAGQSWTMLTTNTSGIAPRSEDLPPTIDSQFVPGFDWIRTPQARVVEKFSDAVSAGISFESPQAVFPPSPFAAPAGVNVNNPGDGAFLNNTTTYSNDIMPDIIGKVAFDPGWGHYEVKGLVRMFSDRANGKTNYTWGYGGGAAASLPLIPKYLDLQLSGLVGAGIGKYGTSLLPDVALSSDNSLVAIPAAHGFVGLVGNPWAGTQLYLYGGWEHAERAGAASIAGYGSPTLVNTGCNIEGSTVCQAETKDIRQVTGGIWQDIFKGSFGRVAVGLQGSYTVRQAFNGVGGGPITNEGIAMASFRYYPY